MRSLWVLHLSKLEPWLHVGLALQKTRMITVVERFFWRDATWQRRTAGLISLSWINDLFSQQIKDQLSVISRMTSDLLFKC